MFFVKEKYFYIFMIVHSLVSVLMLSLLVGIVFTLEDLPRVYSIQYEQNICSDEDSDGY
jgi:hypothetical protein